MILTFYTLAHTAISIVAIVTGIVVVADLLGGRDRPRLTAVFLGTAFLASATGFGFPGVQILPSHVVGIAALLVLAATLPARYRYRRAGRWGRLYAGGAVASLYLLVFVAVAQTFAKVAPLRAAAPTQSEGPFVATQAVALVIFAVLGVVALRRIPRIPA